MKYRIDQWRAIGLTPRELRLCLAQELREIHNRKLARVNMPKQLDYELLQRQREALAPMLAVFGCAQVKQNAPAIK